MAELIYLDFDLSIEGGEGKYQSRVLASPAGQAANEFSRPFSDLEMENFYLRLGRPRQGVRRLDTPEMETARRFGGRLFQAVFAGEVYACFRSSLAEAQAQGKGLRLRLRMNTPELGILPWEYLFNPAQNLFLSLSVETPIVRYVELPQVAKALEVKPPLKLLAVISSPADMPPLDVEREWAQLKEAVAEAEKRGLISLERLPQASLDALQRRLRQGDVHILHFIGHGKFDPAGQEGLLLFETPEGRGHTLSAQYLGTLLHNHRPLRLVVLNACEGARTSTSDPFAGSAQTLVQQGIPAVIAMQFEVTDQGAITFSREFYSALVDGYPLDAALVEARTALFAQGNDIEWGTPVYFTRAPDGRVFDTRQFPPSPRPTTGPLPKSDPNVSGRLNQLYLEGLSAFWLQDWETAHRHFTAIAGLRPDFQNVLSKLAETERQMRLRDLYAQARQLHQGGRWPALINVFEQIQAVEPGYPDPEKLLEKARAALKAQQRQQELDALYRQALEAMNASDWPGAIESLQRLLKEEPKHPNAAALLQRARNEQKKSSLRQASPAPDQPVEAPADKKPPRLSRRNQIVILIAGMVAIVLCCLALCKLLSNLGITASETNFDWLVTGLAPVGKTAFAPLGETLVVAMTATSEAATSAPQTYPVSPSRTPDAAVITREIAEAPTLSEMIPLWTPSPERIIFKDNFYGDMDMKWKVWGDPRPVISLGPQINWLSLSAPPETYYSAGVTARLDFFNKPGVMIWFSAGLLPDNPNNVLVLDWDRSEVVRGPGTASYGVIHLEIHHDGLTLNTPYSDLSCVYDQAGLGQLYSYLVQILQGQGVALFIYGRDTPVCLMQDMGLEPQDGWLSLSGSGMLAEITVSQP